MELMSIAKLKKVAKKVTATVVDEVAGNERQKVFDLHGLHMTVKFENILGTSDTELKVYCYTTHICSFIWREGMEHTKERFEDHVLQTLSRYIIETTIDQMGLEDKLRDLISERRGTVQILLGYKFWAEQMHSRHGICSVSFGDAEGSLTSGPVRSAEEAIPFMMSTLKYRVASMYCLHDGSSFDVDLEWF